MGTDFAVLIICAKQTNQCVSWLEKVYKRNWHKIGLQNEYDLHFRAAEGWGEGCGTAYKEKYNAEYLYGAIIV